MGNCIKKSDSVAVRRKREVDDASPSTSDISTVEEQIERSKAHWSTLSDCPGLTDVEKLDFEVSNKEEFLALQSNPACCNFFWNFSGDGTSTGLNHEDRGELVVGRKFAEGGQAELYEAQINRRDPSIIQEDQANYTAYVLKVFKKGTLLKYVKSQFPHGLLRQYKEVLEDATSRKVAAILRVVNLLICGVLLKDGRFAFLMLKLHFDLRTVIERNMKLRSGEDCGPFAKEDAELMMYEVAMGVEWLHNYDIVHRDLKASNVLVNKYENCLPKWGCHVADYECSIGIIGTRFFRALEILQACKDQNVKERPEVFSKEADVYSYGMTCYEILTGKLPFEDQSLINSSSLIDLVINENLRPKIPKYVDDWICELLDACWQVDASRRPSIGDVLNVLLANSVEVSELENWTMKRYGESYRMGFYDVIEQ